MFAIIYGLCLLSNRRRMPRSEGEMLDALAEKALARASDAVRASKALRKLAVLCVERCASSIHGGEVGDEEELRLCCSTGVVLEQNRIISFPVQILIHWFAAEALTMGEANLPTKAALHAELENWRYPLTIALAKASHAQATDLLAPIVRTQPAFAAQAVRSAITRSNSVEDYTLPPALECGKRVRATLETWLEGLGLLAKAFAPLRDRSGLPPLAIERQDKGLEISWYEGEEDRPEIMDACLMKDSDMDQHDWPSRHWSVVGRQPAWAWLWSLDRVSHDVTNAVKQRTLGIPEGPLAEELLWQWVLELTHRGGACSEPIALEEIEQEVSRLPRDHVRVSSSRLAIDPKRLNARIAEIRADGSTSWPSPTPGRDLQPGAFVWSSYSDERLLAKTVTVFEKALQGYDQMVDLWFPCFRERMEHAATLPARIKGVVIPSNGTEIHDSPRVSWYFEPLPKGSQCEVDLSLGTEPLPRSTMQGQYKRLAAARPEAATWISAWQENSVLDIFNATPVTDMVYQWIERDLKRIGWIT